jgi:hypothetical protein
LESDLKFNQEEVIKMWSTIFEDTKREALEDPEEYGPENDD